MRFLFEKIFLEFHNIFKPPTNNQQAFLLFFEKHKKKSKRAAQYPSILSAPKLLMRLNKQIYQRKLSDP